MDDIKPVRSSLADLINPLDIPPTPLLTKDGSVLKLDIVYLSLK